MSLVDAAATRTAGANILESTRGLPTPLLAINEPVLTDNIDRMQALCDARGVRLRPHVKTHKSTFVAARQRARGAVGLTVATLAEAEAFAEAGHDDLLAVFPPVDDTKRRRLAALAKRVRLTFSVDDARGVASVDALARASGCRVGYYWEIDTGTARGGTLPSLTLSAIDAAMSSYAAACFEGLMSFGGHLYTAPTADSVTDGARRDSDTMADVAGRLIAAGTSAFEVSVGATPGAAELIASPLVTELRSGNYVFNDATQVALGAARIENCAQVVVSTVLSRPDAGRITMDAGSKAIPKEIMSSMTTGFGVVLGHLGLTVAQLYEEVGVVKGPAPALDALRPGDRIAIVTNHACSATVLYPEFVVVPGTGDITVERVDARDH